MEEAEHERKVKQAAESAVEKYHVYDDDYDVEDVEEPLVMIPKQNPGTPEAKAATMPASKKDMDDIADNNPFVQNLFKRSHKQVRQERPAREKLAASTNTAKAPQTLAAPASEPTAPQSETFNVPVTPVPVQPVAPSAPASTVAPAVPETVDTVDFVDDIPLDIEFDDTEADIQNKQPDQSVQNEAVPTQPVASQNAEAVPVSSEPTAQLENVPAQEPTAFAAHLDASPDTKEKEPEKNLGYHEPVGEMVIPDKKPEQLEKAETLLMIPDYLNFLLSGVKAQEYTNATTTQLVNPETGDWNREMIQKLGYPEKIFLPIREPGTVIGRLKKEIQEQVGFDCEIVLPATHDTGSAVVAVPSNEEHVLYISSGTWSLMGTELKEADCGTEAMQHNFTNEGGYNRKYRFLKNIMGLWMVQSVKKESQKI